MLRENGTKGASRGVELGSRWRRGTQPYAGAPAFLPAAAASQRLWRTPWTVGRRLGVELVIELAVENIELVGFFECSITFYDELQKTCTLSFNLFFVHVLNSA